jgi:RND family efflux transporter MFP subunit
LLLFLLGMAALFALLFGDRLRPRIPVTVAPALLLETGEIADAPGHAASPGPAAMIAQASGWIEPDPFPVRVAFKTDGFVATVLVLEGQAVRAGELLATLDDATHRLAEAAEVASLAEAEAMLKVRENELVTTEARVAATEARVAETEDRVKRLHAVSDADAAPVERITASRALAEALAAHDAALIEVGTRRIQIDQQQARVAMVAAALDRARLELARTRVRAPMDGIVLARHAAPGMKRMAGMDDMESSSAVTLYDPARMQARVDVPLSDIGRIETGMAVRVVTAALPNMVFTGLVTRITGEADLTRNTLQVKVALRDPDPRLRPEMLCRAEFLAPAAGSATGAPDTEHRVLWIPAMALVDGEAAVWVIDPVLSTAERRAVTVGAEERDGFRPVFAGLRAGEKVVTGGAAGLRPGALIALEEGAVP